MTALAVAVPAGPGMTHVIDGAAGRGRGRGAARAGPAPCAIEQQLAVASRRHVRLGNDPVVVVRAHCRSRHVPDHYNRCEHGREAHESWHCLPP